MTDEIFAFISIMIIFSMGIFLGIYGTYEIYQEKIFELNKKIKEIKYNKTIEQNKLKYTYNISIQECILSNKFLQYKFQELKRVE